MNRTLIELYDERPLENVLACEMLDPVRVVFMCPEEVRNSRRRTSAIKNYLKRKGWNGEIRFVAADMLEGRYVIFRQIVTNFYYICTNSTGGAQRRIIPLWT